MRDGKFTLITRKQGLPGQQVTALFEDDEGVLWMGIDEDLFAYSHEHFTKVLRSNGEPTGMVVGMAQDANRAIWITTAAKDHALLQLDPKTRFAQVVPTSGEASRITSSSNGVVYISFYRAGKISVVREDNTLEDVALPTGPRTAQSLLSYGEKSLFVGTNAGLYRWKEGKWSSMTTQNGLPCATVQDLVDDEDGDLWLHLSCGFAHISKADLNAWSADPSIHMKLKFYDPVDGARAGRVDFGPGHARTPNGQLWFADGTVLQMIDPHNFPRNDLPPPVHIRQITADNNTYDANDNLRLPPRVQSLAIDYTALSLVAPEKVRFRYKLEGQNQDWQEVVNERRVQYTNLAPGDYRFRVQASNNSGVWNERGASLDFSIEPAYWQTNWFRAVCALLLLALAWAGYQLRIRSLHRQFEMTLNARVAERTRIARDLHDTLLQSFHGLLLRFQTASDLLPARPAEAKQTLTTAIDQAAEAITEGRDAVQGLRSSATETNDLAESLRALGEELSRGSSSGNALQVEVQGTPRALHPIVRDEVFRIAGEALRNAFHHADAKQIELELRYDERQLRVRIRDDGKGIDPAVLRAEGRERHFGLQGMRERAKSAGGKLTVWSGLDAGTEVELSIPASYAYSSPSPPRSWLTAKVFGHDETSDS